MKKLNYLILGIAGLALSACSQEDVVSPAEGVDGNFNLTVSLPADMSTRASENQGPGYYGQGFEAQKLLYAVYEVDENGSPIAEANNPVIEGETSFPEESLKTTVGFNLARSKYYSIAFFAQSEASMPTEGVEDSGVYVFDAATQTITVNYGNMTSDGNNADAYDCFYKLYTTGKIGDPTTPISDEVVLTRPVAQINWGSDDLDEDAVNDKNTFGGDMATNMVTTFTTQAYTSFNMFDRSVSNSEEVTLEAFTVPTGGEFPVEGYDYVAMQYVLAPVESSIANLNLSIESKTEDYTNVVAVANAPIQANYRTNIYGSLLTDNVNVKVTKDPIWGDPDYDVSLSAWDGTSYKIPRLSNNTYMVGTAEEFYGLWKLGQTGNWTNLDGVTGESAISRQFVGKTIVLTADIDLGGHEFPRFGYSTFMSNTDAFSETSNAFAGVFDGQGYTISNFSIESMDDETNTTFGLFGIVNAGATVKNVNFANVNIQSSDENYCTGIIAYTYNSFIENVNVLSGTVKGKNNVGGVVGMCLTTGPAYYIKECSNAASVSGNFGVGGIVGFGSGFAITDCKNTGAVTGTNNSIGGIIGEQRWYGNITGCENTGTISGPNGTGNVGYAVGGIVGWIRNIDQFKPNGGQNLGHGFAPVQVLDNTNSGSVYGGFGVAGIVGTWYYGGVCTGNVNNAPVISASTANASGAAAGIVGATNLAGLPPSGNNPTVLTVSGNTSNTTDITGGTVYTIVNLGNPDVSASGNTPENAKIN